MTPLWTARDLQAATNGHMPIAFAATGLSIDTRTLIPGDLFIALQGETDGHDHAADALAKGAAGVLIHHDLPLPPSAPTLRVPDTLEALTALGRHARARMQARVVAVTGSVGKTTTKDMLRTALAAFGPTHAAPASYNNHWGVPLTLARTPADAAFCVVEIGMNNPGEIRPLSLLARPHVAVITTVTAAHIGHLGSLDAIAREKAAIAAGLEPSGIAVLPADSAHLATLTPPGPVLRFGKADAAEFRLVNLTSDAEGSTIQCFAAGQPVRLRLLAPGAHMAMNAMAVLTAVHALGLDPARAATALAGFRPGAGRGQQRRIHGGDVLLLDESYNASAASVRAALDVLATLPATRRVAVIGDMLELGPFGRDEHESLAPDVAKASDLLYACGPLTRFLYDRVPPALRAAHADDAEALAPIVAAAIRPGDAVLVKGSLGSRMRVVVRALDAAPATLEGPG